MRAATTKAAAQPPNTRARASLTPVMSATVTKIFSGTRESAERVARCSFAIMDERSMPTTILIRIDIHKSKSVHTLNRIIHSHTCFEHTECPESVPWFWRCDRSKEGDRGHGANQRGEFSMKGDRCVGSSAGWGVRNNGCVNEGTKHHRYHET